MTSNKRRRHTPDQIIRKLAEGNKLLAGGADLDEVCRHLAIAESTWHRWLAQYRRLTRYGQHHRKGWLAEYWRHDSEGWNHRSGRNNFSCHHGRFNGRHSGRGDGTSCQQWK